MERRDATSTDYLIEPWRRSAQAAVRTLSSTDGRWALVSTSITALIAGSIAWLAQGTALPTGTHNSAANEIKTLMPYELFQRLEARANESQQTQYASLAPLGGISTNPLPSSNAQTSLDNPLAAENAGEGSDVLGSQSDARTVEIESGQTLAGALVNAGVSSEDANAAVLALAKVYDLRAIRAGQSLDVTFAPAEKSDLVPVAQIFYAPVNGAAGSDNAINAASAQASTTQLGKLLSVTFSPSIQQDVTIVRGADGRFTANSEVKKLEAHYHRAGARIDSSLYLAAMQGGIPAQVVVQMIHMFSYEVDFQRDLKPGDTFEVLYSYYYTPDGKPAKQGQIDYATIHLAGRAVTLYRYQPKGEPQADFLDARGQSAKSMLMKTPVDGARISSGFGMRFHPVLGYTRMHKGIDFAVPTGTPVMAAGSGVIQTEGWEGGYGNFIVLNHGNSYSTAYGHLSRFAPGIRQGSHVHQGQVIAYSGATGLATGPHLHYEIRINGTQVNPATVKVARGRILFGHDLRDFLGTRLRIDSELAAMPLESRVADTASDLRATKD